MGNPADNKLECREKSYLGMILGIAFGFIIIVILMLFVIVTATIAIYFKRKGYEKEKNICVFKMNRSKVKIPILSQ